MFLLLTAGCVLLLCFVHACMCMLLWTIHVMMMCHLSQQDLFPSAIWWFSRVEEIGRLLPLLSTQTLCILVLRLRARSARRRVCLWFWRFVRFGQEQECQLLLKETLSQS